MGKASRYTHRTAVGNERLLGIEADAVRLRVRANEQGGKRVVRIAGDEFIGRLLQHVLPSQAFMRRLAALEISTCPHCRNGRLRLVQVLAPQRSTTSGLHWGAACRGPP